MLSPSAIEDEQGLAVLALRTPTLPPATATNTSFVGRRDVWVVDPATPFDAPRDQLLSAVRALPATGRRAVGIVLTHHHGDHMGAAAWLREAAGLPVYAHPRTAELLGSMLRVDETLEEGAELRGSEADDDRWAVLHTPGHASGHIVLWEAERRRMIAGDMVAGIGTILVEAPDGHMATYIAQLERLADLGPERLVPAHGPVLADGQAKLRETAAHRLMREQRVVEALEEGPGDLVQLTARSYPELARPMLPLAARSCLAHLQKLCEEGRARLSGEVYEPS
ncbi:MAG: MBL fold metallo-hydrolase [Deltaproteobacteria bacterium]|nr:MBL fold metallo-hydrolase [Deltaproteobacteria bacterium]MCB9786546.1 MBL fold metallo-hydrolase [Deltaproteobacteria bacterium]